MGVELSSEGLAGFFLTVMPHLDERQRRVVAGAMVRALGRGGQARGGWRRPRRVPLR